MNLKSCLIEIINNYTADDYHVFIYATLDDWISPFSLDREAKIGDHRVYALPDDYGICGNAAGIIRHWEWYLENWSWSHKTQKELREGWLIVLLREVNLDWDLGLGKFNKVQQDQPKALALIENLLSISDSPFSEKFKNFLGRTQNKRDTIEEWIIGALDFLTPWYRYYIGNISRQQAKIFTTLLSLKGSDIKVRDLSRRVFIQETTMSSQIHVLLLSGYLIKKRSGKTSYYRARDPLIYFWFSLYSAREIKDVKTLLKSAIKKWLSSTIKESQLEELEELSDFLCTVSPQSLNDGDLGI